MSGKRERKGEGAPRRRRLAAEGSGVAVALDVREDLDLKWTA